MNLDGSDVRQLTFSASEDFLVIDDYAHWQRWSVGGRHIVFQRTTIGDGSTDADLWLVDFETGEETQLTDTPDAWDSTPSFAADGKSVLFESDRNGGFDVYRLDLESSQVVQLTNEPGMDAQPKESPDGETIAFASNRDGDLEIYVMDADGTNVRQLTDNEVEELYGHWSPDGKRLVFQSSRDGNREIYVMNADGSDQHRLNPHPADDRDPHWVKGR
jgi:TolB protein